MWGGCTTIAPGLAELAGDRGFLFKPNTPTHHFESFEIIIDSTKTKCKWYFILVREMDIDLVRLCGPSLVFHKRWRLLIFYVR